MPESWPEAGSYHFLLSKLVEPVSSLALTEKKSYVHQIYKWFYDLQLELVIYHQSGYMESCLAAQKRFLLFKGPGSFNKI